MSRIGNKRISLPEGVSVVLENNRILVSGTHGKLDCQIPIEIRIEYDTGSRSLTIRRNSEDSVAKSLHGLIRSLVANMVAGVSKPWEKRLEIVGVGYQAMLLGNILKLNVGFANPMEVDIPSEVKCELPDTTHIVLSSANKQLLGQVAANIRALRPPEPYKGKGVRYVNEHVRRKSGKAFGS